MLAPNTSIRAATVHDVFPINEIMQQQAHGWSASQVEDSLNRNHVWVVEDESLLVGFAIFTLTVDTSDLLYIAIDSQHRRKGLAQYLLTQCFESLYQQGMRACLLEVRQSNQPAIALYEVLGFEYIGERKDYYSLNTGKKEHAHIYKKLFT